MCAVVIGAVNDTGWEGRVLVILSGILTILLSILLGGFVKHLASHQEYDRTLEQRLEGTAERLFARLERTERKLDQTQTKEQCDVVQKFLTARLGALEHKIDAVLRHHGDKGSS